MNSKDKWRRSALALISNQNELIAELETTERLRALTVLSRNISIIITEINAEMESLIPETKSIQVEKSQFSNPKDKLDRFLQR